MSGEVDLETSVELLNQKIADLTDELSGLKARFKNFYIYECRVKTSSSFEQLKYTAEDIENDIRLPPNIKIIHIQVFGSFSDSSSFITEFWIKRDSANNWKIPSGKDPSGDGARPLEFKIIESDNKISIQYRTSADINPNINLIMNIF